MLQETKQEVGKKIIFLSLRFLINYIKYPYLAGAVIFPLATVLFTVLNLNPDFSFGFLRYFSFVDPRYATDTFSMGITKIMEIFLVVSLVLMAAVSLMKIALRKVFNREILISSKSKIIISLTAITLLYLCAMMIVAFSDTLDKSFYVVFFIFYILNVVSTLLYFVFDALSKWLHQQEGKLEALLSQHISSKQRYNR